MNLPDIDSLRGVASHLKSIGLRIALRSWTPSTIEVPPQDQETAIAWMNHRHFIAQESGAVSVYTEDFDPTTKRFVLRRSTTTDLAQLYRPRFVVVPADGGKTKNVPLADFWMSHAHRREYRGVVFHPGDHVDGHFNLWRGFACLPREGDWSLMERHIREVICDGKEDLYRYVRRWMAFAVQCPGTLPEVALVLIGQQGTGKTLFATQFGTLFGQHFVHVANAKHLVGNFNAHLRDAVLVFADEAYVVGDKQAEGNLKSLVTEEFRAFEGKHRDAVIGRNLAHLILASNHDRVIEAAPEERRFCVLNVSNKYRQNYTYFAALIDQMNKGGREAMLYDLEREDLSGFHPRDFPRTLALHDQQLLSLKPLQRWWLDKLEQGCLSQGSDWKQEVVKATLLDDARLATYPQLSVHELLAELRRMLPTGYPADGARRTVGDNRWRTWRLPPLGQCRDHFDQTFGSLVEWTSDSRADVSRGSLYE